MTDCEYCGEQVKKDDDFVLVGKYPSGWKKWEEGMARYSSPEDFGAIFHKSCYDEMIKKENTKQ